jgi:hypothetical protein
MDLVPGARWPGLRFRYPSGMMFFIAFGNKWHNSKKINAEKSDNGQAEST